MSAYEKGWLDCSKGVSFNSCPFYAGSGEAIAWRNGWKACNNGEG